MFSTQNAIKTLIEERFDRFTGPSTDDASDEPVKSEPSPDAHEEDANGYEEEAPARKKQKREVSTEDEDAKLAAELQAQENNLARTRATRGGNTATKKRKAPRKKSAKKVQDDSGAEGSDGEAPKRKAGGGFQKPFTLSYPLAQLVGEPQVGEIPQEALPRTDLPSCPVPRLSRSYGSTSRATSSRTQRTSARFAATTRCRRCSSRPRSTCSR